MRQSQCHELLQHVLEETIPMHARMIHGRRKNGALYEESQAYDANGRVSLQLLSAPLYFLTLHSTFEP